MKRIREHLGLAFLIIIAIFAVGIVSTVKRNKNQSTDMDDSKEE